MPQQWPNNAFINFAVFFPYRPTPTHAPSTWCLLDFRTNFSKRATSSELSPASFSNNSPDRNSRLTFVANRAHHLEQNFRWNRFFELCLQCESGSGACPGKHRQCEPPGCLKIAGQSCLYPQSGQANMCQVSITILARGSKRTCSATDIEGSSIAVCALAYQRRGSPQRKKGWELECWGFKVWNFQSPNVQSFRVSKFKRFKIVFHVFCKYLFLLQDSQELIRRICMLCSGLSFAQFPTCWSSQILRTPKLIFFKRDSGFVLTCFWVFWCLQR